MQPFHNHSFSQPPPPPLPGAASLSSPFGTAITGTVRSSPFGATSSSSPPTAQTTGNQAGFGTSAIGGMAPPVSMTDITSRGTCLAPPPTAHPQTLAPHVSAAPSAQFYPATATSGGSYPGDMQPTGHQQDAHTQAVLQEIATCNAPKDFVRASVSKMPNSVNVKQRCKLPLGVILQPLAPVVDPSLVADVNCSKSSGHSIVRCVQCRAYINPFVQWEAHGRQWRCNLCGKDQQTPEQYSANGVNRYQTAELCKGAVEYAAPEEYTVRSPQPPVFMFVIDVSYAAVATGMLHTIVDTIKEAISQHLMPGGKRLQIGIMTFDASLHFYNLNPKLGTPQMLVVSDLQDLFLPLPDSILVNAHESESSIINLLDSLPIMFQDTKVNESCMGSAVKGASLAMKHIGGKLLVFGSCIPSVGDCALKSTRNDVRLLGTEREVELLRPSSDVYKELANELTRAQISVELFVGASEYVDLASIAPLALYSGGDVRYYPGFHIQTQGMKLKSELLHVITRYMGWEAVMCVRLSRGWKITKFYGHLFTRHENVVVVPNCHADRTFAVTIDIDEIVAPDPVLYVQSALLYTNSDGERRIRVNTWAAPTTHNYVDVVNSVDAQATAALLCHIAVDTSSKQNLVEARDKLSCLCRRIVKDLSHLQDPLLSSSQMLHGSNATGSVERSHCLAEALGTLPLYVMGMLKSVAFRSTNEIGADVRTFAWARLETLTVSQLIAYFCPRLMGLHNLPDHCGVLDESGNVQMPHMLGLTRNSLTEDGVYLLDDGEAIVIWIGRAVDPAFLQAVFGNSNIDELQPEVAEATLGMAPGDVSSRIGNILRQVRAERQVPYLQLLVAKGGDGFRELRFFSSLLEDRTLSSQTTYMEFLQRMGYRSAQQAVQAPHIRR